MTTQKRGTRRPAVSASPAQGAAYVATVELTTKDGAKLAQPGETCERVPESSLPWLIEQGLVVLAGAEPGAAAADAPEGGQ